MQMLDLSIHILLIDDDIVDIMDMTRMFKKNKISNPLHVALNGLDALAMLREKKDGRYTISRPSIILLDLNMPKMNGIEFLQQLRADPDLCSMLVFVLTSSNAEQDKIDAYNLNIAGYILKPLELANFTQTISVLNYYWTLLEFPSSSVP